MYGGTSSRLRAASAIRRRAGKAAAVGGWLRARLAAWLREHEGGDVRPERRGTDVARLRRELARVETDLATLDRLLARSPDSFHASLAAGTTAHAEGLRERRARLRARIAALAPDRGS